MEKPRSRSWNPATHSPKKWLVHLVAFVEPFAESVTPKVVPFQNWCLHASTVKIGEDWYHISEYPSNLSDYIQVHNDEGKKTRRALRRTHQRWTTTMIMMTIMIAVIVMMDLWWWFMMMKMWITIDDDDDDDDDGDDGWWWWWWWWKCGLLLMMMMMMVDDDDDGWWWWWLMVDVDDDDDDDGWWLMLMMMKMVDGWWWWWWLMVDDDDDDGWWLMMMMVDGWCWWWWWLMVDDDDDDDGWWLMVDVDDDDDGWWLMVDGWWWWWWWLMVGDDDDDDDVGFCVCGFESKPWFSRFVSWHSEVMCLQAWTQFVEVTGIVDSTIGSETFVDLTRCKWQRKEKSRGRCRKVKIEDVFFTWMDSDWARSAQIYGSSSRWIVFNKPMLIPNTCGMKRCILASRKWKNGPVEAEIPDMFNGVTCFFYIYVYIIRICVCMHHIHLYIYIYTYLCTISKYKSKYTLLYIHVCINWFIYFISRVCAGTHGI